MSLLKHRRDQVRVFLLDKKALDSLGNAYADEMLFEAGIHPKTFCRSLTHEDGVRLHAAIVKVMQAAVAEVARRDEPIERKVRDFLKSACATSARAAAASCAPPASRAWTLTSARAASPPPGGAGFVDWTNKRNIGKALINRRGKLIFGVPLYRSAHRAAPRVAQADGGSSEKE